MIKLTGAILIILATTLTGFYYAGRLRDRTGQLRELQMALQMLETEICYGSTPLHMAFQKISKKNSGVISTLFGKCTYYLQELDGATTFECWQQALEEIQSRLCLKKSEIEWLEHFGQIVGGSDRIDQTKHIQLMMAHLKKTEVEAKEEQIKHEKMYRTLGFLAGLLIVILMM